MRHAFGFVLGILLTPALAYGAGWGCSRAGAALDPIGQTINDSTRMYGALSLMAAVGLVTGVIIVARWASPLASLIPALAFIGWTVYFLVEPKSALQLPGDIPPAGELDAGLQLMLSSGVFALLGFALLMPAWAPRRWRRERPDDLDDDYSYG
ncbi:hypothetical protein [Actinomadura sp. HBU206391]|uniref:hypothetical protein n=1 Tax=Actinomadura sp. HBU206391 TaxID=2731692 RepID=UPI00164FDD9D|nr:hypothetical protein [Actinomadura sp. HBU206391]MBC6463819.1 hypothetical protein [Actinomadura sp. HBU206391]